MTIFTIKGYYYCDICKKEVNEKHKNETNHNVISFIPMEFKRFAEKEEGDLIIGHRGNYKREPFYLLICKPSYNPDIEFSMIFKEKDIKEIKRGLEREEKLIDEDNKNKKR